MTEAMPTKEDLLKKREELLAQKSGKTNFLEAQRADLKDLEDEKAKATAGNIETPEVSEPASAPEAPKMSQEDINMLLEMQKQIEAIEESMRLRAEKIRQLEEEIRTEGDQTPPPSLNIEDNTQDKSNEEIEEAIKQAQTKIENLRAKMDTLYKDNLKPWKKSFWTDLRGKKTIKEQLSVDFAIDSLQRDIEHLEIDKARKENPFRYFILDRISERTRKLLGLTTEQITAERVAVVLPANIKENVVFDFRFIRDDQEDATFYSQNGFVACLLNKKDVLNDTTVESSNDKARYAVVAPDGAEIARDIGYQAAVDMVHQKSRAYQEELVAEFERSAK